MKDINWTEWNLNAFRALPVELRKQAVNIIRKAFDIDNESRQTSEIVIGYIKSDTSQWWAGYHHGWGTAIRNLLREEGITDDKLPFFKYGYPSEEQPSGNWDDYYIAIVEVAFKEGTYHSLTEEEKI
jgi:hypothetical protein